MITQIEIDGFKTFKDFKVELAPFQVIVGPNGSGKSNLFDALQLVSQFMIPGNDVYKAMQGIRGQAGELFTKYPDGTTSDTIRIAVEMLIDQKNAVSGGREIDLEFFRFRYELEIIAEKISNASYQQYSTKYNIETISNSDDKWCEKYNIPLNKNINYKITITRDTIPYEHIAEILEKMEESIKSIINKMTTEERVSLMKDAEGLLEKTSFIKEDLNSSQDPYELRDLYRDTVQQELRSLSFYHLNPEALRKRSSTSDPPYLAPDGSNLPATLARIKAEDPEAFQFISHDITSLVSDVLKVDVEKYDPIDEYGIRVTTSDKRSFTAQALSDGTLRLLALATLRNDPQFHGTICIEEPENGVQPHYLNKFARLLHDMTTDFSDSERADEPLRQVIVTTYSPTFISQPEVIDHLLLATTPTLVSPQAKQPLLEVTRMDPVITPETLKTMDAGPAEERSSKYYTIDMARQYLDSDTLQQASKELKEARADLHKKF